VTVRDCRRLEVLGDALLTRIVIIVIALVIAALVYFGIPALKRSFIGNSLQTRVKILVAEDDPNCQTLKGDEKIPKTVLEMDIFFPMGSAPENVTDLNVTDDSNQQLEVIWTPAEKEDLPDQALTRWHIREAYFPFGFRQGTLREKTKDLTYFKVPQVPYNVGGPAGANQ
jgi:hypothetical protein